MAETIKGRAEIPLTASICTSNPTGTDIYDFGAGVEAEHVANTGIERQGGVTPIYELVSGGVTSGTPCPTPGGYVSADANLLYAATTGEVTMTDPYGVSTQLGNVGVNTIYRRGMLAGYADAAWTADNFIIGIKYYKSGSDLYVAVYKINPVDMSLPVTGAPTNPRLIAFTGFTMANLKSISLIRYKDMAWSDNQEFYVRYSATTADKILKESGTSVTTVATNAVDRCGFAHRFTGANRYIWGEQGRAGYWYVGDILFGGGGYTIQTNSKWCIIDRFLGTNYERAVLTYDVLKTPANTLAGISTVGYTVGGVWSATQTDYGVALGAVTVTLSNIVNGPGYSEACYTRSDTGTNIYNYLAPTFNHTGTAHYDVIQSQTRTTVNAYGKLTDIDNNHSTWEVSWRVGMINGTPSYLAAADVDSTTTNDHLGVPITNVGEFDPYYIPHCVEWADPVIAATNNSGCIYRYNGVLFFVWVSPSTTTRPITVDKVSDTLYQFNCLSPISLLDTTKKQLVLGVNDYNGRVRFTNTGAIVTGYQMASNLSGDYSNSIDPGSKTTTNTLASGFALPFGIEPPAFWTRIIPYAVRIFATQSNALTYYESSRNYSSLYTDATQANLLFVTDTRLPIAMGYRYGYKSARTDVETLLTGVGVLGKADVNYSYVGYEIGNQIDGAVTVFSLFGDRYIHNGYEIRLLAFSGPIFTGSTYMAAAAGLQYIASAPTTTYFLSAFDNSIYTFEGGRSVEKFHRMNDMEAIVTGVFSVVDNTLLLTTARTLIFVRDKVISSFDLSANQYAFAAQPFDTQLGLFVIMGMNESALATVWYHYKFSTPSAAELAQNVALLPGRRSLIPLTFQSAYFGFKRELQSLAMAFTVTLYSPSKAETSVVLSCYSFDADNYYTQSVPLTIRAGDWNSLGLYRARIQPKTQMAIGASVGVYCADKIVITGITVEYAEDAAAIPAPTRSI